MTEQELLAQPQSEYMSNAQQAFFRNLLVRQRGDLAVRVGAELEEIAKLEPATAEEDLASRETQRSWDLRMLERDRQMLSKIEQ
ncbi:TPA: RNA polymerase-binding protein DksA, partial [Pseudomonas aeruginosa]